MTDLKRFFVFSTDEKTMTTVATSLAAAEGRVVRSNTEAEFRYCLQQIATFDAAIVDISAERRHFEMIQEFVAHFPTKPLIAIVAAADLNSAMQAIRLGATDYLLQPVLPEEVPLALNRALQLDLSPQFRIAQRLGWRRERDLGPVVGSGEEMLRILQTIGELARKESHILFCGEEGVGKTYFARLLHFLSPRRFQPLLRVACANKTSGDLLLELFGTRGGLLYPTYDATLLLEQSHALPVSVQNRLAHFIEEQNQIQPASGIRLIGLSTDAPDEGAANLFNRIGASLVHLPNLMQRQTDLPRLCQVLLQQITPELDLPERELQPEALSMLRGHTLAGNIRELNTILRRAAIMSRTMGIESHALQAAGFEPAAEQKSMVFGTPTTQLEDVEQVVIRQVLLKYNGNVSRTATALGISRGTLYNKMKKYGLAYSESEEPEPRN
ncbi:MAG TPA: helix-turn-helix domain-containing protein [bacterium]|nr:helix-turn-helix domain-containing protein [bacterium]